MFCRLLPAGWADSQVVVVVKFLAAAGADFIKMVMGYFIQLVKAFIGLYTFFVGRAFKFSGAAVAAGRVPAGLAVSRKAPGRITRLLLRGGRIGRSFIIVSHSANNLLLFILALNGSLLHTM